MRGADLSRAVLIEVDGTTRRVEPTELPLSIGGPGSDIVTAPGADGGGPHAYVGADDEDLFVQPAESSAAVLCNGGVLSTSQWLRDGDVLTCDDVRVDVGFEGEAVRLKVEQRLEKALQAPRLTPPPRPRDDGTTQRVLIQPVDFTPKPLSDPKKRRGAGRTALVLTWIGLGVLAFAAWFTFTARTVELSIDPQPDEVEIRGTLLHLRLGGRHLLRPGSYTVTAEKEGFRRLESNLEVTHEANQFFQLHLERLPGTLSVKTDPSEGVAVVIDERPIGTTPLEPIELSPGEHVVEVSAERYESSSTTVSIAGAGSTLVTEFTLRPLWAPVVFESKPSGALVRVDGDSVGRTPLTADLLEGGRNIEMRLDGYKPHRASIRVVANQPLTPRAPVLQPVEGWLSLTTEPSGATITIDGEYRGLSPLELEMVPGSDHRISASMAGHHPAEESLEIDSGRTHEVHLQLAAEVGEVSIAAEPADAELLIDGQVRGAATQTVELTAVPHQIEIRKPGYVAIQRQVTPRPGFPLSVEVTLQTEQEAQAEAEKAARPPVTQTSQGQKLVLIAPGRFRMGASRREPGRRANEALREVEITRPFYLATEEVSNKEFNEFRAHRAGVAGGLSLDLDDHPVVEITWEAAARYCNWLSAQQSLQPFYVERDGRLVASQPPTTGYRLPTEAEWAWAARYEGGGTAKKYPWGDALPVAPGSGNYADGSARDLLPTTLAGYHDKYPATAPVDAFEPNGLGLFNLGGNVAEWMHDYYSIVSSSTSATEQDPTGPEEGEYHVIRGSSWMDSTITELRFSYRDYANKARSDVGFRVARYAD